MVDTLSAILHDILVVLGVVAAALLVGLVVVNLGLLLPGLLTWLDGRHGSLGGRFLEPGPVASPTISEPAYPRPSPVADGPTRPTPVHV